MPSDTPLGPEVGSACMNLLDETRRKIAWHGYTDADVRWVGDHDAWCSWDEFAQIASGVIYDAGYGGLGVSENLLVVGDDWWLERHEYDGCEWWEFKRLPTRPKERQVLIGLRHNYRLDDKSGIWREN